MGPVCMRKNPSQPHAKMHNLYYLLHIYIIEICISQYIGTPGTDIIAGFSYEMKCRIMILNLLTILDIVIRYFIDDTT